MKAIWCIVGLLAIRFVTELIISQAVSRRTQYDATQKGAIIYLVVAFAIIGGCIVYLGISQLRNERYEPVKILAY